MFAEGVQIELLGPSPNLGQSQPRSRTFFEDHRKNRISFAFCCLEQKLKVLEVLHSIWTGSLQTGAHAAEESAYVIALPRDKSLNISKFRQLFPES